MHVNFCTLAECTCAYVCLDEALQKPRQSKWQETLQLQRESSFFCLYNLEVLQCCLEGLNIPEVVLICAAVPAEQ